MQRGAPALLDKFTRTKMALVNGADLVLELPTCYAASSAEFFAKGSVALFDKLGVTTNLCFGSECGNIEVFMDSRTAFVCHVTMVLICTAAVQIGRAHV